MFFLFLMLFFIKMLHMKFYFSVICIVGGLLQTTTQLKSHVAHFLLFNQKNSLCICAGWRGKCFFTNRFVIAVRQLETKYTMPSGNTGMGNRQLGIHAFIIKLRTNFAIFNFNVGVVCISSREPDVINAGSGRMPFTRQLIAGHIHINFGTFFCAFFFCRFLFFFVVVMMTGHAIQVIQFFYRKAEEAFILYIADTGIEVGCIHICTGQCAEGGIIIRLSL